MGRGRSTGALLAIVSLIAAALPLSLVVASAAPAAAAPAPVKIMPLGDSITLGAHDNFPSSPGGYRDRLEDILTNNGYSFDFVGTQTSGPSSLAHKKHEGHSGFTSYVLKANLSNYLAANTPNVVLLMIGTNDIGLEGGDANVTTPIPDSRLDDFVDQVRSIISTIQTKTSATVILAKPTPWKVANRLKSNPHQGCTPSPSNPDCIADIFKQKRDATYRYGNKLAALASSRVKVVDMFSSFLYAAGTNTSTTWLADDQHPNQTGYNKMASRWYDQQLKSVLDNISPANVPSVPLNVSATPGNGKVTINFSAPADNGGAPITRYDVVTTAGGFNATGAGSPLTVTGLTNGTQYTFKLHAVNSAGPGADATVTATPRTVPGTPTIGTAIAGAAKVTVKWTPPGNTGGAPLTGYSINAYKASDLTTVVSNTLVAAPATQADVTQGIVNGTSYKFKVAAGNVAGIGAFSAASNAVTPTGALSKPGAPQNVTGVAGDTKATVTFQAPASNGGSTITSYKLYQDGGTTPVQTLTSVTPFQVTGLTNGQTYTFTVTATNAQGEGPASNPPVSVTPHAPTAPQPPTNVHATAGNAQATVSFTPPVDNGGAQITSYTVTPSTGTPQTGPASPITVPNLANGTPVTFTVHAHNSAGDSVESSPSNSVTPTAASETFIGDLTPASTSSARFWRNQGASALPLKVLGLEYAKGVQVDPGNVGTFTMTYNLSSAFSRFQSDVGIDNNVCGGGGNVRFKVFKNGDLANAIYDSGTTAVTGKTTPTLKIDIPITGATSLTLQVLKSGTATCNYADWADAKLVP